MKTTITRNFCLTICMVAAFFLRTLAIRLIDVQAIGPHGTSVGFATMNQLFHEFTGVHFELYTITDWLSLIPLSFMLWFAILGLIQWIKRKHLLKVDYSILVLGGFYIIVILVYTVFEVIVVNYRPVLIDGNLEASYPSSTTMLVMCVMLTSITQLNGRIKNVLLKRFLIYAMATFTVFMVIGRLISGVHWFTDIVGGALVSAGLVLMYRTVISIKDSTK